MKKSLLLSSLFAGALIFQPASAELELTDLTKATYFKTLSAEIGIPQDYDGDSTNSLKNKTIIIATPFMSTQYKINKDWSAEKIAQTLNSSWRKLPATQIFASNIVILDNLFDDASDRGFIQFQLDGIAVSGPIRLGDLYTLIGSINAVAAQTGVSAYEFPPNGEYPAGGIILADKTGNDISINFFKTNLKHATLTSATGNTISLQSGDTGIVLRGVVTIASLFPITITSN
jgi:hypothetical protein